jgi:hypothetical protein
MREFHVQRAARERYAIESSLFGVRGDLLTTDLTAIRRLAARLDAGRAPGTPGVAGGDIVALGLLHEIGHLVVARYATSLRPRAMDEAVDGLRARLGPAADALLERFAIDFPPPTATTVDPPPVRLESCCSSGSAARTHRPAARTIDDRPSSGPRATATRSAASRPSSRPVRRSARTVARSSSCCGPRHDGRRRRWPDSSATSARPGPGSWATRCLTSSPGWT